MMQAGRNVVIEKPMSMNSKMVKELTDKAKEQGVFIMEVCGDTYRHGHGTGCVYHGGMLWRLQTRPRTQGVFIMEVCGDTCRHGQGTGCLYHGGMWRHVQTCLYHGGMLWRMQTRPGKRVSLWSWRYVVAPTDKAMEQGVFIMEICGDTYTRPRNMLSLSWRYVVTHLDKAKGQGVFIMVCCGAYRQGHGTERVCDGDRWWHLHFYHGGKR